MIRLVFLAWLAFTATRLTNAAAPALPPSIISVPVISPAHTFIQRIVKVQSDEHEMPRLPTVVTPSHYHIIISPYFDTGDNSAFTFQGKVLITVRAQEENVVQIVMHYEDLEFESITVTSIEQNEDDNVVDLNENIMTNYNLEIANNFVLLNLDRAMSTAKDYVITADYAGNIRNDMQGFYRSWYYENNELRWVGTTHLQPSHARKVFPCFDEPKFKATFTISIDRPEGYSDVLSNMPIETRLTTETQAERQTFYPTPVMSTYLVAFVISQYESQQVTEQDYERPFGVHARTSAEQDGKYAFDMGQKILSAMEHITDHPYYTMAANMKMDLVAIPDHSDGAMENYGLLAFREPLVLSREGTTSDYYKQRIIGLISHEVAHMWFGNLVTCEWWDNLWLNEGFARYYEMFLAHKVAPEMGFDTRFVTEHMFNALYSDSFPYSHALTTIPRDSSILSNDYDPHSSIIVYSKGASILRQTEHLLGEETFEAGLRIYLTERKHRTATPEHLWDYLQTAASDNDALTGYDITVAEYFSTWSTQPGFPLLTVHVSGNTISILQTKFNTLQETAKDWIIPITYATASEPDFLNTKPSYVMKEVSMAITKLNSDDEWVLFNKQATGFYRVNYDDASWDRILDVLRGPERETIHHINRAQIVNDVFALAMLDTMTYERALELVSWLEYETDFAPWAAAIDSLDYLRQRALSVEDVLTALDTHVITLANTLVEKIGFEDEEDEDFMKSFTRLTVAPYLCRAGHAQCIEAAVTKFEKFKQDSIPVSPNSRPWVYCNALRHGTVENFNFLWSRYLAEEVSNEKQVILEALGCTSDEESLLTLLNHIISGTLDSEESIHTVRTQDILTAFNTVLSSNTQNVVKVFEWFQIHWPELSKRLKTPTLVFHYFGRNLHVKETVDEFIIWIDKEDLGVYKDAAYQSTLYAMDNLNWIRAPKRLHALMRFFNLEMEPVTTEPTTPKPSSGPQGTFDCVLTVSVAILFHIMVL